MKVGDDTEGKEETLHVAHLAAVGATLLVSDPVLDIMEEHMKVEVKWASWTSGAKAAVLANLREGGFCRPASLSLSSPFTSPTSAPVFDKDGWLRKPAAVQRVLAPLGFRHWGDADHVDLAVLVRVLTGLGDLRANPVTPEHLDALEAALESAQAAGGLPSSPLFQPHYLVTAFLRRRLFSASASPAADTKDPPAADKEGGLPSTKIGAGLFTVGQASAPAPSTSASHGGVGTSTPQGPAPAAASPQAQGVRWDAGPNLAPPVHLAPVALSSGGADRVIMPAMDVDPLQGVGRLLVTEFTCATPDPAGTPTTHSDLWLPQTWRLEPGASITARLLSPRVVAEALGRLGFKTPAQACLGDLLTPQGAFLEAGALLAARGLETTNPRLLDAATTVLAMGRSLALMTGQDLSGRNRDDWKACTVPVSQRGSLLVLGVRTRKNDEELTHAAAHQALRFLLQFENG